MTSEQDRILLGLAVLETVREYGEYLSQEDLADICGVTKTAIAYHEHQAINKMRKLARERGL